MRTRLVAAANVEALGFRVSDLRLLLNSHAHYDHADGNPTLDPRVIIRP